MTAPRPLRHPEVFLMIRVLVKENESLERALKRLKDIVQDPTTDDVHDL